MYGQWDIEELAKVNAKDCTKTICAEIFSKNTDDVSPIIFTLLQRT